MIYEWQVLCMGGTVLTIAAPDGQQAMDLAHTAGLSPVSPSRIKALVDWSKPTFDRQEAAEFLGYSMTKFEEEERFIPHIRRGHARFPRRWLEEYQDKHKNQT